MSAKLHKSNSEVEYIPRHRICWYYTKRIPLSFHSFETHCSVFPPKNPTIPPLITSFVLQITIGAFLKRLANLSFFSFFFRTWFSSASHTFITLQNEKANLLQKQTPIFSEHILFLRRCPQSLSEETPPTHTKGAPILFLDIHSPSSLSWRFSQGFGRKKSFPSTVVIHFQDRASPSLPKICRKGRQKKNLFLYFVMDAASKIVSFSYLLPLTTQFSKSILSINKVKRVFQIRIRLNGLP